MIRSTSSKRFTLRKKTAWAWDFQSRLRGVKGITNLIHIQQRVPPAEIKEKIEEAFRRSAELDAARVTVETDGGAVTLKGTCGPGRSGKKANVLLGQRPASPGWITGS